MNEVLILIAEYRYLIIFPLAAIEGPIVAMAVGFLVHEHFLLAFPSLLILILGDVIPDYIYYYIGRYGNKKNVVAKYRKRFDRVTRNIELMEKLWEVHPRKTMFLGKLAYGLSIPILISAGLVKFSSSAFLKYSAIFSLFQYSLLMTVGYYLGHSAQSTVGYVRIIGLTVSFLVIVLGVYFINKYARKEIEKMEEIIQK